MLSRTGTGTRIISKTTKMMLVSMMHSRSTSKKRLEHLGRIHMMSRMKIVARTIIIVILINFLSSIIGCFFTSIGKDGVGFIDFFEFGFMVSFFSIGTSYVSIWMMFQSSFLIGFFDFLFVGILTHSKNLIIIFLFTFLQFQFGLAQQLSVFVITSICIVQVFVITNGIF